MENFKFSALCYLNDWCIWDRKFIADFSPSNNSTIRLKGIRKAANYYRVARNFKLRSDENRLEHVLQALDGVTGPITDENVDSKVCGLAEAFRQDYGRKAISAASKFLWICHQHPVVIYDGNAVKSLNKSDGKLGDCPEYAKYRIEWLRQFTPREPEIQSACAELVRVKDFSLADDIPDDELNRSVSSKWFIERVFDYFLWLNASGE